MPIEMPPDVAYRKPNSLSRSRKMTVSARPASRKLVRTSCERVFFRISAFRNPPVWMILPGTMLLNSTRPAVVWSHPCLAGRRRTAFGGTNQKKIVVWYSTVSCRSAISISASVEKNGASFHAALRFDRSARAPATGSSAPGGSLVRKYEPSTMSCDGSATGRPSEGLRMLFDAIISTRASICASNDSGTCTAIWSPSKSALNAAQTSGWIRMALPSTSTGSNAWMPRRWSVGARFSSTGWSWMICSRISYTSGLSFSTIFLARLTVSAMPFSTSLWMMNGLKSSTAIALGRPHWWSRSSGPTTMTDRPE